MAQQPRKKVDYQALQSELKRIPNLDLPTVRDLMDLGFSHIDELRGRAPEALYEKIREAKPTTPEDRLYYLRMAVYYSETSEPDLKMMQPWRWH